MWNTPDLYSGWTLYGTKILWVLSYSCVRSLHKLPVLRGVLFLSPVCLQVGTWRSPVVDQDWSVNSHRKRYSRTVSPYKGRCASAPRRAARVWTLASPHPTRGYSWQLCKSAEQKKQNESHVTMSWEELAEGRVGRLRVMSRVKKQQGALRPPLIDANPLDHKR